jgi:hypothetical protein
MKRTANRALTLLLTLCLTLSLAVPALAAGTAAKVEDDVWTVNFYSDSTVTVTRLEKAYETGLAGITVGSNTYSIGTATNTATDTYGNVTQATWTGVTYNSGDTVAVRESTTALTIEVDGVSHSYSRADLVGVLTTGQWSYSGSYSGTKSDGADSYVGVATQYITIPDLLSFLGVTNVSSVSFRPIDWGNNSSYIRTLTAAQASSAVLALKSYQDTGSVTATQADTLNAWRLLPSQTITTGFDSVKWVNYITVTTNAASDNTPESGSGGGSAGTAGGGSSTTTTTPTTTTTTGADGSTTTTSTATTTDSATGAVTETTTSTTTAADGSTTASTVATTTAKDGTVTETATEKTTTADGAVTESEVKTVTATDGSVTETTASKTTAADGSTTESKSETVTAADGAKTETVTETAVAADGATTETSKETVTTAQGVTTSTETVKAATADGTTASKVTTVDETGASVTVAEASISAQAVATAAESGAAVTLPITVAAAKQGDHETAPVVALSIPENVDSVKVEIPVENVTPGTVVVLVHEDGTEEIVKLSAITDAGVALNISGNVTVKLVDNTKEFDDVADSWAGDAITFATSHELFNGQGDGVFAPEGDMTRSMLVTVLARLDGVDTTTGSTWDEAGLAWAVENGISDGTNGGSSITREMLATMLYRYVGTPVTDAAASAFPDADQVSSYAAEAMNWAVSAGIIGGTGDGTLNPSGSASRAEVATMLQRFTTTLLK